MDNILESLFPNLREQGVADYDDLTDTEKETYRKILDLQQRSQITLEDYKKHIHAMRQSVEYELAKLPNEDLKNTFYKSRLLNYLLLEALFERPERAQEMLKNYSNRKVT